MRNSNSYEQNSGGGRLAPEALLNDLEVGLQHIKDCRDADMVGSERPQGDMTDYDGMWERAAKRAEEIDPGGERSRIMLIKDYLLDNIEEYGLGNMRRNVEKKNLAIGVRYGFINHQEIVKAQEKYRGLS